MSEFRGGFPTPETVQQTYDEADLNRAVQAYRFAFPLVSGLAIWKGQLAAGVVPNTAFGLLDTEPKHVGFTLNSDTPYGMMLLDLSEGPMAVEIPAGPLVVVALDVAQRWVGDLGIPGPDAGKGGAHVFVGPEWDGDLPGEAHVWRSRSNRVVVGARSIPVDGDIEAANERIPTIKVHRLGEETDAVWADLTPEPQDTTPLAYETSIEFWRHLHEFIETEPHVESFYLLYGELAALGIAQGQPFEPDERMTAILENAARIGNAQLRVQSFADRRPDRVAWPGAQWEWASLRSENGAFEVDGQLDVVAREKWFFQAIAASPAMFRRQEGAGSLYWLGERDSDGDYLDGAHTYRLTVPLPVPARLFWSTTVYDTETRSQVQTDQNRALLRSLIELREDLNGESVDLFFGPEQPENAEGRWVKTIPGKGWFAYFRIYGPEAPAFDGSWRLPDFEKLS
jgi:hypothetical protein